MLLTKSGYGVKDAFVIPCGTKKKMKSTLSRMRDEMAGASVTLGTLQILLEAALADGVENGKIPAPGILDVLEICNLLNLRPQITEISKLLDFVDPGKMIKNATPQALGRWINDELALDLLHPLTDSWFEDTEETRKIVATGRTPRSIETKIWKFLERRRDLWARRFLQTAMMLRDAERLNEWETLTASAYGLMSGRSLKRIPLMDGIAYTTIKAAGVQMW